MAGMSVELIDALIRKGATDLTIVSNHAGNGDTGRAALLAKGRVRRAVCSFTHQHDFWVFDGLLTGLACLTRVYTDLATFEVGAAARGSSRRTAPSAMTTSAVWGDHGCVLQPDRRLLDRLADEVTAGRPPPKSSKSNYPRFNKSVLHRPVELAEFRSRKFVRALHRHDLVGSMGKVGVSGANAAMESFFALLEKNVLDRRARDAPATSCGSRS